MLNMRRFYNFHVSFFKIVDPIIFIFQLISFLFLKNKLNINTMAVLVEFNNFF